MAEEEITHHVFTQTGLDQHLRQSSRPGLKRHRQNVCGRSSTSDTHVEALHSRCRSRVRSMSKMSWRISKGSLSSIEGARRRGSPLKIGLGLGTVLVGVVIVVVVVLEETGYGRCTC
jgi:hypothetical protein